jgi:hypothetical protein
MAIHILPRIDGKAQHGMIPHMFSSAAVCGDKIMAERTFSDDEDTLFANRLPSGKWAIVETGEVVDEFLIFSEG